MFDGGGQRLYNAGMNVNLKQYGGKRICVAVSGGKDSMALLHYLKTHGESYNITLSALNCDHGMRGEASERDSAFVAAYCGGNGIKLHSLKAEKGALKGENDARLWRWNCYNKVLSRGEADLIATAHHLNDNAETVLFNLARGTYLSGMTGITDEPLLRFIRPLIGCSRGEIDAYIEKNGVPFVTDESNFTDDYTRNKIRHNVLPALEDAVHGAAESIYRFSRLAAEDEEYFERQVERVLVRRPPYGYLIKPCSERVIFRRAAQKIVADCYQKKDYTSAHFNALFDLQLLENGKKFEFLGLVAVKEEGGVAIASDWEVYCECEGMPFWDNLTWDQMEMYAGVLACAEYAEECEDTLASISERYTPPFKILRFDIRKIPDTAVIRFRKNGDKFTKFGGGTKSLSDYLTDKKVPQSLRDNLPLVCDGDDVLMVGGVEISEKVKLDKDTVRQGVFICADPFKLR
ncbi:MAG: tRNA lysidine(34) synthetase TilS [Clostridiales bacterium]|nr:tRNA lysidine(34) synthetase TilS [Clostridiales bacterium]